MQHLHDSIIYDPRALNYLIAIVGIDQVMPGMDWPHQLFDIEGVINNTAVLAEEDCNTIRRLNAKRVFGF